MTCILREFPALSKWVVYWLCTSPRRCNPSTLIFISLDFSLYCERDPFLQGLKIINQGQELAMGNFWLKPQKAEVPSNNFLMEQGKKAEKHQIHTIRYHRIVVSRVALILFACGRRHLCSDSEQTPISTIISWEWTWLHDFSGTWWNWCICLFCFVSS